MNFPRLTILFAGSLLCVGCVPEVSVDPMETSSGDSTSQTDTTTASSDEGNTMASSEGDGDVDTGDGDSGDGDSGDGDSGDGDSGDGDSGDGDSGDGDSGDGDSGDGDSGDGDSGDGDSGDGDGDMCAGTCIPSAPVGWSDAFAQRNTSGECGAAFATEHDTYFADLTGGGGSCSCSCSGVNPTGGSCPQTLPFYNGASSCPTSAGSGGNVAVGSCFGNSTFYYSTLAGSPSGVSCGSGSVSDSIPTPSWGDAVLACTAMPQAGSCENAGDQCMPVPTAPYDPARLCVSHAGNLACPAGYPEKSVYYTDFNDTRECPNTCTCGSNNSKCQAQYTGYSGTTCSNAAGASSFDTDDGFFCILQGPILTTDSVRVTSNTVDHGSCNIVGSASLNGSLVETGETTVCCTN